MRNGEGRFSGNKNIPAAVSDQVIQSDAFKVCYIL